MATRFSSLLFPDNSTDANFRAWAQFFEDTLVTTGGWQLSTEAGETAPAALAHPTNTNQKRGFRVYKMADSLQASYPVYIRIDYGSSAQSPNGPGIWYTIGTGSNGSGTITGILFNGGLAAQAQVCCSNFVSTGAFNSYGSSMPARAAIAMFVSGNSAYHFVFIISRTKSSQGVDNSDGLLITYRDGINISNGIAHCQYLAFLGGVQPVVESGMNYILSRQNPGQSFGGDIGVGVPSHFKGVAMQPGTNFLITNSGDLTPEATISIDMYGTIRTYVQLNALPPYKALSAGSIVDTNARCLMRYD
jgi:hypothetical protein